MALATEVRSILVFDKACLYLEIDERYPMLWQAQTTWSPDYEVVELPTGAR